MSLLELFVVIELAYELEVLFRTNIGYLCNVKYLEVGIWSPLLCRVTALEGSECRRHRAHSVIIVDTMHCIRKCHGRHSRIESNLYGSETMVLTG